MLGCIGYRGVVVSMWVGFLFTWFLFLEICVAVKILRVLVGRGFWGRGLCLLLILWFVGR